MRITNPTAVLGENAACQYLKVRGFTILERNFRKGYGEIDIIALKGKVLIFIEVKTRSNNNFGDPFEAISKKKLAKLIEVAKFYKYSLRPDLPDDLRIDAIGVRLARGQVKDIEHIENITSF